jgi:formylglycine-generating enzyme required for sulfatase activity
MFWGGPITALPAEPPPDEELQRMVSLVKQLGDSQFLVRESAGKQLVEFGERALPVIRQAAANSKTAELRYRTKYVIRKIMLAASQSKSTGLETVIIEAGEFLMGSSLKEPGHRIGEIPHRVRISQPFLLGRYEVNQGQFQEVMGFTPSHFRNAAEGQEKVRQLDTGEFPVERVSWFDAVAFCNRLSKRDGYGPYYKMANVQRDRNSIKQSILTIEGGNGYRLPTEAEWEYACRAATTQRFHFGSSSGSKKANFVSRGPSFYGTRGKEKSLGRTAKVGSYMPNVWGLHDMHGNVAEWCWDWYAKDYYAHSLPKDPGGPGHGHHRVLRGGSWLVNEASCRSASRFYLTGDQRKYFAGFRVARTP